VFLLRYGNVNRQRLPPRRKLSADMIGYTCVSRLPFLARCSHRTSRKCQPTSRRDGTAYGVLACRWNFVRPIFSSLCGDRSVGSRSNRVRNRKAVIERHDPIGIWFSTRPVVCDRGDNASNGDRAQHWSLRSAQAVRSCRLKLRTQGRNGFASALQCRNRARFPIGQPKVKQWPVWSQLNLIATFMVQ
jgi:hypothetical protein